MNFDEFIEAHPELIGLDAATQEIAYAMYTERLTEAMSEIDQYSVQE